jgi:Flp pilus assembly protein TadB
MNGHFWKGLAAGAAVAFLLLLLYHGGFWGGVFVGMGLATAGLWVLSERQRQREEREAKALREALNKEATP